MGKAAIDVRAGRDGDAVVGDVAGDAGAFLDDQLAHADRALDIPRQSRGLCFDMALDVTVLPLHQGRAADVAFHAAINMKVDARANVAVDDDVGADDREGGGFTRARCS